MYLSTKSGVSFQTAWAFAVILAASFSATYLDVASDCEQQSKTELKTIHLSFVWSLCDDTRKNTKVKKLCTAAAIFACLAMSHMHTQCHA